MADPFVLFHLGFVHRRALRRERLFRDRNNPLDFYDDVELYNKFRFRRENIFTVIDELADGLRRARRLGSLPPSLQVCLN